MWSCEASRNRSHRFWLRKSQFARMCTQNVCARWEWSNVSKQMFYVRLSRLDIPICRKNCRILCGRHSEIPFFGRQKEKLLSATGNMLCSYMAALFSERQSECGGLVLLNVSNSSRIDAQGRCWHRCASVWATTNEQLKLVFFVRPNKRLTKIRRQDT